jgi:hypothetical protein
VVPALVSLFYAIIAMIGAMSAFVLFSQIKAK